MSSSAASLHARRWWTLAVLSLTQMMVALDATVINIALPRAQRDLNFSVGNREWLVTSYALAFGSLLLLGGRLSDLWGRRTALFVGLGGFAVASAVGGAAGSFAVLVSARACQGAFGALVAPAALAALTTTFVDQKERANAFAIYGALGASGAVIGLLLGGALTQWTSWRWCLWINVVVSAIAGLGVARLVASSRGERRTRLDVPGALLGSGGLFFVVFGLSHAVTSSWSAAATWLSLVVGGLLMVLFLSWQRRSSHPLLPLRVLFNRTRAGSLVALFITSLGIFALTLFLAYYLQGSMGYSPLRTGVAFLPMVAAIVLSATVASARLLANVGPRPLVPAGMILAMLGTILFTKLGVDPNYWGQVLPGLVVTGLGLGLIFAPATASATAGVEPGDAGAASALVTTSQQGGVSMGTALLNTIAVSVTARAVNGRHAGVVTQRVLERATLHGYAAAFWWAASFLGVGAVTTFLLLESGVPELEGSLVTL